MTTFVAKFSSGKEVRGASKTRKFTHAWIIEFTKTSGETEFIWGFSCDEVNADKARKGYLSRCFKDHMHHVTFTGVAEAKEI